MSEVWVKSYNTDGQSLPTLFGVSLRDAFADLLRDHYGNGRRKKAAKALKLSDDAARRLCEGRPSMFTVEEALAERPDLYVEIGIRKYGDAFRQAFREHLAKEDARNAEARAALGSVGRHLHLVDRGDPAGRDRVSGEPDRTAGEAVSLDAGDGRLPDVAPRSERGGRT